MASLMFTVQISFIGCEDNNDDSGPDVSGSADQFAATNNYDVNARIVGILEDYSTCADIQITKDGAVIEDALVLVNSDTIPYDFGVYQLSLPTSNSYDLTITHNGNLIASGEGVKIPDAIPVISNLDSGDVHQKNTDLTVRMGFCIRCYFMAGDKYCLWITDLSICSITLGCKKSCHPWHKFYSWGT